MRRTPVVLLLVVTVGLAWWLFASGGSKTLTTGGTGPVSNGTAGGTGDPATDEGGPLGAVVTGSTDRLNEADSEVASRKVQGVTLRGRLVGVTNDLSKGTIVLQEATPDMQAAMFEVMRSAWNDIENSERVQRLRRMKHDPDTLGSARIRADGSFELVTSRHEPLQLVLKHPIARLDEAAKVDLSNVSDTDSIDVGELKCSLAASLLVSVEDAGGRAIRGATVRVVRPFDPMSFVNFETNMPDFSRMEHIIRRIEAKTNDQGIATLEAIDDVGPTRIEVRADGHGPASAMAHLVTGRRLYLRVKLPEAARLDVVVLDAARKPVADASVAVEPISDDSLGLPLSGVDRRPSRVQSGDDGHASLRSLPAGACSVRVRATGFRPLDAEVRLEEGRSVEREFLLDRGRSIRGVVVDDRHRPLEGVRVGVAPLLGEKIMGFDLTSFVPETAMVAMSLERAISTNADGTFVLSGLDDEENARVIASLTGHTPVSEVIKVGSTDVEFVLSRLGSVTGVVVREEDGKPVTEFTARSVSRAMLVLESKRGKQETGENGHFTLSNLPQGSHSIEIEAEGRAPRTVSVDLVDADAPVDIGTIELAPPSGLFGVVVDPADKPIEGVTVRVSRGGMADMAMLAMMRGDEGTKTNGDGEFELVGLPSRRLRLRLEKPGFAPTKSSTISIEKGKRVGPVRIVLSRGSTVDGMIVDADEEPLEGWLVSLKSMSLGVQVSRRSDARGAVHFEGVPEGSFHIEALPGDFMTKLGRSSMARTRSGRMPDIGAVIGETMRTVVVGQVDVPKDGRGEFRLVAAGEGASSARTVRVEGRVTIGSKPLEGGLVEFEAVGSMKHLFATVEQGQYEIRNLEPGSYRARVRTGLLQAGASSGDVVQVSAEPRVTRVDLELPGGKIAGRVTSREGKALPFVLVRLTRDEDLRAAVHNQAIDIGNGVSVTDSDGRFSFEGLVGGVYAITARQVDARDGPRVMRLTGIELAAGQHREDLELVVEDGLTLRVSVKNADASSARGAKVRILDAAGLPLRGVETATTDEAGQASVNGLAPGAYRVLVEADGHAPEISDAIVIQGDDVSSLVRLEHGVPVRVRFEGKPDPTLVGQRIAYALWDDRERFVRGGFVTVPEWKSESTVSQTVDLGRLRPGRYRARLESFALGAVWAEREVSAGQPNLWSFEVDGRSIR
ncbi:MAG: carboxypeptidase regulatory-like domain-containing protein [Planctomycetes bacterium]|nr:carboxypeptidase regulatory-like domain-containing protein [Planctomycetota bacterium]